MSSSSSSNGANQPAKSDPWADFEKWMNVNYPVAVNTPTPPDIPVILRVRKQAETTLAQKGTDSAPAGDAILGPDHSVRPTHVSPTPVTTSPEPAPTSPLNVPEGIPIVAYFRPQLLKGPGIDVVVGPNDASSSTHERESWSLPKALIGFYSPLSKSRLRSQVPGARKKFAPGSLLRRFFFDLVATFFHVPARVVGTTEEWDEIMSEHAELRANLLSGFRKGADQRQSLEAKDAYMVRHKTARPSSNVANMNENTIIPAKRRADGARVKKEV
ncbi:hypothetical protein N0V83_000625 [Neocucurbitaria cava]|uniref:Uncharacterized protein n=1 Tax=Neocucurbitaria cava TaxID=798079 RepID=A0A9W9CRA7_9PLEO|nr:hypothetical protein N0V83_000625 [Neocucurbitaria cava]